MSGASVRGALSEAGSGTSSTGCATSARAFAWGYGPGSLYSALDTYLLRGRAPWTLHHHRRLHAADARAGQAPPIDYPKPDGKISFDRLSSVFISNTNHEEDQPPHLQLARSGESDRDQLSRSTTRPNSAIVRPGSTRSSMTPRAGGKRLQINAQNCVHCKTCDIKDPEQNIDWVVPEGGGGPNYPNM